MDNTQRVNRAVAIAASEALTEQPNVENPNGFRTAVGRRIQGTYGAALRKLAEESPDLSPDELYELVIVPGERGEPYPQTRPETPKVPRRPWVSDLDEIPPVAPDLSERVQELRALIAKGAK